MGAVFLEKQWEKQTEHQTSFWSFFIHIQWKPWWHYN